MAQRIGLCEHAIETPMPHCLGSLTTVEDPGFGTTNKGLLKIVDVLGRESKAKPNTPLFYIYEDGTLEKRLVIE